MGGWMRGCNDVCMVIYVMMTLTFRAFDHWGT